MRRNRNATRRLLRVESLEDRRLLFDVPAETFYLDNNGTNTNFGIVGGNWNTAAENRIWNTDLTGGAGGVLGPWQNDNFAVVRGLSGTLDINQPVQARSLSFESPSGTTVTISGSATNNLTLNSTTVGGTQVLVNSGVTGRIDAPVAGSNGLSKLGPGTLALAGANTYNGLTTVNSGTLVIANSSALGTTAAGTNVVSGARVQLTGGITTSESFTIAGPGSTGAINGGSGAAG
ncbi:MAG: autotransporter-associated beta strand repeat-containing protein, partial [Planctomycetota bacterium]